MTTHSNKTEENKNQVVIYEKSQKSKSEESAFQFVDNRSEAIAQRKLLEMTKSSPQVSQLISFQKMANKGPHDKQPAQLQSHAFSQRPRMKTDVEIEPFKNFKSPNNFKHIHHHSLTFGQSSTPVQRKFTIGKDEFEYEGDVLKNKPLMNFLVKRGPYYAQAANELACEEKDYGTLSLEKLLTYISDRAESLEKTRTAELEERNTELSEISGGRDVIGMLASGHSYQQHLAENELDAKEKATVRWVIEKNESFSLGYWLSLNALQNCAAECINGHKDDFAATVDLKLDIETAVAVGIGGEMYQCDAAIIVIKEGAITTFYPVVKDHIGKKGSAEQLKATHGEGKKPAKPKGVSKANDGKKKGKK